MTAPIKFEKPSRISDTEIIAYLNRLNKGKLWWEKATGFERIEIQGVVRFFSPKNRFLFWEFYDVIKTGRRGK